MFITEHGLEAVALIAGTLGFLWAAAVIATGTAMLITEGELRPNEIRQLLLAGILSVTTVAAYLVFGPDSVQPPPLPSAEHQPLRGTQR